MSDFREFYLAQKKSGSNIETSTRCTLQCPQCQRIWLTFGKDHPRYKEIKTRISNGFDLPLEDFKKIVEFSENRVNLCGQISDPIWWPHLRDALVLMNDYPTIKLVVSTSAHQRNIEWYRETYEMTPDNVIWRFGLDGIGKTSEIYRVKQDSELIWEAMLLGKEMGKRIEWQFIVFDHNVHEVEEAKALAKEHNMNFVLLKTDRTDNGFKAASGWEAKRNKEEQRWSGENLIAKS